MTQNTPIIYGIRVYDDFVAELDGLDNVIRICLRKTLDEIILNPHILKNRLSGDLYDCYKIKLKSDDVRLVYQVNDDEIHILLLTVDKCADNTVAKSRVGLD